MKKGSKHSNETRMAMSLSRKGINSGVKHPLWGKHHSPETKDKQRVSHTGLIPWNKGKNMSAEFCSKVKKAALGKKMSSSMKEKTSKRMIGNKIQLGKKYTQEQRKKRSESQMGSNGPNWKGGRSSINKIVRGSSDYFTRWVEPSLARDKFTCQQCGIIGAEMHIHHMNKTFAQILVENNIKSLKEALSCEELWDLNNSQTLCVPCHKKTDTFAGKIKNQLL